MESTSSANIKGVRKSIRVITPDQIKKLGLDATLRHLVSEKKDVPNNKNSSCMDQMLNVSTQDNNISESVKTRGILNNKLKIDGQCSSDVLRKSTRLSIKSKVNQERKTDEDDLKNEKLENNVSEEKLNRNERVPRKSRLQSKLNENEEYKIISKEQSITYENSELKNKKLENNVSEGKLSRNKRVQRKLNVNVEPKTISKESILQQNDKVTDLKKKYILFNSNNTNANHQEDIESSIDSNIHKSKSTTTVDNILEIEVKKKNVVLEKNVNLIKNKEHFEKKTQSESVIVRSKKNDLTSNIVNGDLEKCNNNIKCDNLQNITKKLENFKPRRIRKETTKTIQWNNKNDDLHSQDIESFDKVKQTSNVIKNNDITVTVDQALIDVNDEKNANSPTAKRSRRIKSQLNISNISTRRPIRNSSKVKESEIDKTINLASGKTNGERSSTSHFIDRGDLSIADQEDNDNSETCATILHSSDNNLKEEQGTLIRETKKNISTNVCTKDVQIKQHKQSDYVIAENERIGICKFSNNTGVLNNEISKNKSTKTSKKRNLIQSKIDDFLKKPTGINVTQQSRKRKVSDDGIDNNDNNENISLEKCSLISNAFTNKELSTNEFEPTLNIVINKCSTPRKRLKAVITKPAEIKCDIINDNETDELSAKHKENTSEILDNFDDSLPINNINNTQGDLSLSLVDVPNESYSAGQDIQSGNLKNGTKRKLSETFHSDMQTQKKLKEEISETDYNPKLDVSIYAVHVQQKLLIQYYSDELKTFFADQLKIITISKDKNKDMCVVCKEIVLNKHWQYHKLKHNNIAWRIGEKPMNLEAANISTVLNGLYKQRKKLFCLKCPEFKKSVFGFLCHFKVCGKTEEELNDMKVHCKVCNSPMQPFFLSMHFKIHEPKAKASKPKQELDKSKSWQSSSKRSAATKANELIESVSKYLDVNDDQYYVKDIFKSTDLQVALNKEIVSKGFVSCKYEGCNDKIENVQKILKHFEECLYKPEEVFMCKRCLHCTKVQIDMKNHVQKHQQKRKSKRDGDEEYAEGEGNSEPESDVDESKSKNSSLSCKIYKLKFLDTYCKNKYMSIFLSQRNYMWMLEFCDENYNEKQLHMKFAFTERYLNQMNHNDISGYLPKVKVSISIKQNIVDYDNKQNVEGDIKQFKLFQTESNRIGTNIFCGGPISAIAWAPTPHDSNTSNQVLAVAVTLDADKTYSFSQLSTDKGLLQFWSFGTLTNKTVQSITNPELEFCIGHNYGYITSMEWCPSGCYDDDRLGLLCISCTDSYVYGLSICQPNRVSGKMFNAKPAFKLALNKWSDMDLGQSNFQPTRISWSKSAGHQFIAVGYSNGVVALFNLNTESEFMKMDQNGLTLYYPYFNFVAHPDVITGLQLFHLNGGNRWLVTGSNDRLVKFWDLQQPALPIHVNNRASISQLIWLVNYIGTIDAHSDFINNTMQSTTLTHIRDFAGSTSNTMFYSSSTVNSISCNEWASIVVQGSDAGEVIGGHFNHFFLFNSGVMPKKFFISKVSLDTRNSKVNKLNGNYRWYKDVCDNFTVVYHDYDMKYYKNVIKKSEVIAGSRGCYGSSTPNIYPIQSVTQTSINPNRYSFYYTAIAYKSGFVKLVKTKMFATI